MEPRHFWRRLAATVVDYVLAALAALLVLWPFLGDTDRLRLDPDLVINSLCYDVTGQPPQAWFDILGDHRLDGAVVCDAWVMGIPNGRTATLFFDGRQSGAITTQSNISFPVDQDGNPVAPVFPQGPIVAGLLILLGGAMLARRGATPGKRLMGLRVVAEEGRAVRGIQREALKYALLLVQIVLAIIALLAPQGVLSMLTEIGSLPGLLVMGAVFLAFVWFYVWPWLRWRGAMRWDAWLGQRVLRG